MKIVFFKNTTVLVQKIKREEIKTTFLTNFFIKDQKSKFYLRKFIEMAFNGRWRVKVTLNVYQFLIEVFFLSSICALLEEKVKKIIIKNYFRIRETKRWEIWLLLLFSFFTFSLKGYTYATWIFNKNFLWENWFNESFQA